MQKRINESVFLVILLFISGFLRFYQLREGEVFVSSDEVNYLLAALDAFNIFNDFSIEKIMVHGFRALNFPYGYVFIVINFVWLLFLTVVGIPVTEIIVTIPIVFIGTITPLAVYFLGKKLFSVGTGILSGLMVAVIPLHVGFSRTNAGNIILSLFLLVIAFYFLINAQKRPTKKNCITASLFIGLYCVSDIQFWGILPTVIVLLLSGMKGKLSERIQKVLSVIRKKEVIIPYGIIVSPSIVAYSILVLKGHYAQGYFGHIFGNTGFGGALAIGLHPVFFKNLVLSLGFFLTTFLIIGFILAVLFLKKEHMSIFAWGIVYLFPWLFLLDLHTWHRAYYLQGIIPFILLGSEGWKQLSLVLNLHARLSRNLIKKIGVLVMSMLIMTTLHETAFTVFRKQIMVAPIISDDQEQIRGSYYYGSRIENTGMKSAGYWIRENTNITTKIFSEYGPLINFYYARRLSAGNSSKLYALGAASSKEKWLLLKRMSVFPEYIIINSMAIEEAVKYFPTEYHPRVAIKVKNKTVLYILSLNKGFLESIDVESTDALFDKKFGTWEQVVASCYFCLHNSSRTGEV